MELLKRYLQEDPSDSFLRYALALEFITLNDHERAYQELEILLRENPDYLPGYYMAGKTSEILQQKMNAIYWYQKGIALAKEQSDLHTLNELSAALEGIDDESV